MADQPWPKAERLRTERLTLEPLRVAHAAEMADVLNDPGLHTFTGGSPLTQAELRKRYESLAAGQSRQGHEGWLNCRWARTARIGLSYGAASGVCLVGAGLVLRATLTI
jgi:hypothetical protein